MQSSTSHPAIHSFSFHAGAVFLRSSPAARLSAQRVTTRFSEPLQNDIHRLTGYTDHVCQFLLRELGRGLSVLCDCAIDESARASLSSLEYKRLLAKFSCTLTLSSIKDEIKASQTSTFLWSMCSILSGSILTARTSVKAMA